ncbi:hypothetical protein [Desulfobacter curvatus]|uniref:hypothetical protein n=1 Tax=Desulfobacter curvatus TaxID=2290 RepID=UPI000362A4A5|nr:hypothetical protein [Desulfobacter curvatus]
MKIKIKFHEIAADSSIIKQAFHDENEFCRNNGECIRESTLGSKIHQASDYFSITAMGRPGISTAGHSPQQSLKDLSNLPKLSYKETMCNPYRSLNFRCGLPHGCPTIKK